MRPQPNSPPALACDPAAIIDTLLVRDRRVMLFGPPGVGKSTLAARLADALLAAGRDCDGIGADPGSPAFGIPGALTLARRGPADWKPLAFEPLCALDAGRFRLPLVSALRRLAAKASAGVVLVDSPGVVRGVAGAELLHGLVEAAGIDLVLLLNAPDRAVPLVDELGALAAEWALIQPSVDARRPGKRTRARQRTALWDAYLGPAGEQQIDLAGIRITGTPPPRDDPAPWSGRQLALLRAGRLIALGEAVGMVDGRLSLRAPSPIAGTDTLLVRDAARGSDGLLVSAAPFAPERIAFLPPPELLPPAAGGQGPRPVARVGTVDAALVNGLFGDPLLHLRLRHRARSLLFDLGGGGRLSARAAHRVSDVFVSHGHMDHLAGFLWLLRSRIGDLPPCRLCGPPGLADRIAGLIDGFLWDRVGDQGAAFEVAELHGDRLHRYRLQAGRPGRERLETRSAAAGVVHAEPGFRVRAVVLDHHTPVLAYAFEPERELRVRKDRLEASGWPPGRWLGGLKERLLAGDDDAPIALPDGGMRRAAELGRELILTVPGKRLVYATDLADTPANRERLIALARHAHTLFLEAAFTEVDRAQAQATGHLTARACGEIAEAAAVARLVPFHLSRRYAADPAALFDEIEAVCGRAVVPRPLARFRAGGSDA